MYGDPLETPPGGQTTDYSPVTHLAWGTASRLRTLHSGRVKVLVWRQMVPHQRR